MITKDRIFKKGDVIVSGFGNIRILVGETGSGEAGDGAKGVFYDSLIMYCESDATALTDMRYARHATEKEKKMFFDTLKFNGLVYDAKTYTIKAGENYKGNETKNVLARKNSKGPQPFKVLKKRVRPTISQIQVLEDKVALLDEVIKTHVKEKKELSEHLEDVKACNDKLAKELKNLKEAHRQTLICDKNLSKKLEDVQHAKELASKDLEVANKNCERLEEANRKLTDSNTTLEQSNNALEGELVRMREAFELSCKRAEDSTRECERLYNRSFWERVFNL